MDPRIFALIELGLFLAERVERLARKVSDDPAELEAYAEARKRYRKLLVEVANDPEAGPVPSPPPLSGNVTDLAADHDPAEDPASQPEEPADDAASDEG